MSLEDFKKITETVEVEEDIKDNKELISNVSWKDIKYYLTHLDELVDKMNESNINYMNSKFKYDFKKENYQCNMNWNKENDYRVADGLPKVTNQTQRDAIISLKLKPLYKKMKSNELEYNMYKKIFDFISKNMDLLCKMYEI